MDRKAYGVGDYSVWRNVFCMCFLDSVVFSLLLTGTGTATEHIIWKLDGRDDANLASFREARAAAQHQTINVPLQRSSSSQTSVQIDGSSDMYLSCAKRQAERDCTHSSRHHLSLDKSQETKVRTCCLLRVGGFQ